MASFFFFSAHDTTIYPLLNAFGAWTDQDTWPPFASHVELELWKRRNVSSNDREDYAVALSYNGRTMKFFDTCESPCPLSKLDALVKDIIPSSRKAYDEECKLSAQKKELHLMQLTRNRLNSGGV